MEFTTTVESNRGMYTRLFETVDEAQTWLIGKNNPGQTPTSSQTQESC